MSTSETLNYPVDLPANSIDWTSSSTIEVTDAMNKKIGETFEEQPKKEEVVMDQETIKFIYWNKKRIIRYLQTQCLKPGESVVKYWKLCTPYHFVLPTVNWFSCKHLDFLTSDRYVSKLDYNLNKEWKSHSCSSEDISNIHTLMRDFMKELWVLEDEKMNFQESLSLSHHDENTTWGTLNQSLGLGSMTTCWINDVNWEANASWFSSANSGSLFSWEIKDDDSALLFLDLFVS